MTGQTQGLAAAALAALLIRISLTEEHLRFVLPWMRWPLLASGVLLLAMAVRPALGLRPAAGRVPMAGWLLLLPTLVMFTVAPPPLGAFVAERRPAQVPLSRPTPAASLHTDQDGPLVLGVDEFTWGAAQPDDVMGLADQVVRMDGFVSTDRHGGWYLTRLVIYCCAADAVVERVRVVGPPAPPRDRWVRVTGTWVAGTGREGAAPARLEAQKVVEIAAPRRPYG